MKKLFLAGTTLFLAFSIISAQPGTNRRKGQRTFQEQKPQAEMSLNLSQEQIDGIRSLKLEFSKNTLDSRNQLHELIAQYQSLMTGENLDLNSIDKNIDQRLVLRSKIMKEKVEMNNKVRNLLTEDQRIILDTKKTMGKRQNGIRPQGRINTCKKAPLGRI